MKITGHHLNHRLLLTDSNSVRKTPFELIIKAFSPSGKYFKGQNPVNFTMFWAEIEDYQILEDLGSIYKTNEYHTNII